MSKLSQYLNDGTSHSVSIGESLILEYRLTTWYGTSGTGTVRPVRPILVRYVRYWYGTSGTGTVRPVLVLVQLE